MRETWVQSLDREDPLEKEMATHSSALAWKIPWTGEPGGLQSWGSKESYTTGRLHFHFLSFHFLSFSMSASLSALGYCVKCHLKLDVIRGSDY